MNIRRKKAIFDAKKHSTKKRLRRKKAHPLNHYSNINIIFSNCAYFSHKSKLYFYRVYFAESDKQKYRVLEQKQNLAKKNHRLFGHTRIVLLICIITLVTRNLDLKHIFRWSHEIGSKTHIFMVL